MEVTRPPKTLKLEIETKEQGIFLLALLQFACEKMAARVDDDAAWKSVNRLRASLFTELAINDSLPERTTTIDAITERFYK